MILVLRVLVGLFALLFLFLGLQLMLAPESGAVGLSVTPIGEHGLNSLRGDMGGMFVGCGVLLVLGLVQRKAAWLLSVALLMGLIACGRLLGFALDGNPSSTTLVALGFEIGMAAVLVLASRKLPAAV